MSENTGSFSAQTQQIIERIESTLELEEGDTSRDIHIQVARKLRIMQEITLVYRTLSESQLGQLVKELTLWDVQLSS